MKKPQALIGLLAALGTAIGVLVAVVGLPYGRADYTAFADLYHGAANTDQKYHVALDCNTATAADDTGCIIVLTGAPQQTTVDVTLGVSNAPSGDGLAVAKLIAAFNFTVADPDTTRLDAPFIPGPAQANCLPVKLNCNPNFLDSGESPQGLGGAAWSCDPVQPDQDANNANGDDSLMSCTNAADPPTLTPGLAHLDLARVTYDVPIAAGVGSVVLTFKDVNVFDDVGAELGSCNPVVTRGGICIDTEILFVAPPPTSTPTDTPLATNTPTHTPTSTPVPDPGLQKDCDTATAGVQDACNLWICTDTDGAGPICGGAGEGELRVVEVGINIQSDYDNDGVADVADPDIAGTGLSNQELGLGAYEFSVEYDNFVIESLNPCDIVFSSQASGVGEGYSNRGDVTELASSLPENNDCVDNNNSVTEDGQCTNSIITENIIHFGCVTAGGPPLWGPASTFLGDQINIASLVLIPHEDLNNDLFPGNNNGVLTVIKDNGCELVDILGHPTLGDQNGGLTPLCGDLAVTARILEGDIDLNCTVNNIDAQAIAVRYGGFFGGLAYSKWFDLEPQFHDLDIDIKDIQKVFGRIGSTCQIPVPPQPALPPPTPFGP